MSTVCSAKPGCQGRVVETAQGKRCQSCGAFQEQPKRTKPHHFEYDPPTQSKPKRKGPLPIPERMRAESAGEMCVRMTRDGTGGLSVPEFMAKWAAAEAKKAERRSTWRKRYRPTRAY